MNSATSFFESSPLCYAKHDLFGFIHGPIKCISIEFEKDDRGVRTRAFVAVGKSMVLHEVKEVSCRHCGQIFVEELPVPRRFWLGDG